MNNKSWPKKLDTFLAENDLSADTRVLARALSQNDNSSLDISQEQHIADLEQALHIEQHLDEIGLQPIPLSLEKKLQEIDQPNDSNNVIRGVFSKNWKKMGAVAAVFIAAVLFGNLTTVTPTNHQPTFAEVKQAEQELVVALQYISLARVKSSDKVRQTFDENVRLTLNQSLFKPFTHIKESL